MLFGKKKKQSNDRVLDLKARVDALRQADETSRAQEKARQYTLDHFLAGDDVLTGREVEDAYKPTGLKPDESLPGSNGSNGDDGARSGEGGYDVDLEAELQKYLQRQDAQSQAEDGPAPSVRGPVHDEKGSARPDNGPAREDARPAPPEQASAADESRPSWLTPFPETPTAPAERPSGPDSPDAAWPLSKQWPAEEEWPPRDRAV